MEGFLSENNSSENIEKKLQPVSREEVMPGAKFYVEPKPGQIIEVEVKGEIEKTNEPNPREYVPVAAVDGNFEAEMELTKLMKQ